MENFDIIMTYIKQSPPVSVLLCYQNNLFFYGHSTMLCINLSEYLTTLASFMSIKRDA